ncbi:MAG: hypothetical protein GWO79_00750 [Actinobacteria bacterium]|nr:hypothetical protein [Actinomycetota bacterium]
MYLYRTILSRAWKTTWNHKYLWFFGLFAALLGGGGEYNVLLRGLAGGAEQQIFPGFSRIAETGVFSGQTLANIGQIMRDDPLSLLALLMVFLVVLALIGFLIWLSIVSQAALVNNAARYLTNKTNKNLNFRTGIAAGKEKFWPVFGLNLVVKFLIYLIFISVGFMVVSIAAWPVYVVVFVIFIIIALALSFVIKYAVAYAVIEGRGFVESIREGWKLFIDNWLISLEMGFILFFINLLAGLALVLIVLTLTIPLTFLAVAVFKIAAIAGFWFVAVLASILLLGIIMLGGALLSTFQISSWTGLFVRLSNKGGTSKIVRIVEDIKEKIAA